MSSLRSALRRIPKPSPALLVGLLALGVASTGTAVAASGTVTNIADGADVSKLAKVDAGGALKVGDGTGALTVDGTVTNKPPGSTIADWFQASTSGYNGACTQLWSPPAGKGGVVKTVTVVTYSLSSSSSQAVIRLWVSPTSSPCTGVIAHYVGGAQLGSFDTDLDPGVAVPAGCAVYTDTYSGSGVIDLVSIHGYKVVASSVPAPAAGTAAKTRTGSAPTG
jgi:hypothetical protein